MIQAFVAVGQIIKLNFLSVTHHHYPTVTRSSQYNFYDNALPQGLRPQYRGEAMHRITYPLSHLAL